MPSWNADLTVDEIDALAGFISSPRGNSLFRQYCEECHDVTELVSTSPFELKDSLDKGKEYSKHTDQNIPDWKTEISVQDRTALLNFLVAPAGQRLFATNCSSCHGRSVVFEGNAATLKQIITQGGMHLEMPSWQEKINENDINTLASFVVNPSSSTRGQNLFNQYCSTCHGSQVPILDNQENARQIITKGGPHKIMPVWGFSIRDNPKPIVRLVPGTVLFHRVTVPPGSGYWDELGQGTRGILPHSFRIPVKGIKAGDSIIVTLQAADHDFGPTIQGVSTWVIMPMGGLVPEVLNASIPLQKAHPIVDRVMRRRPVLRITTAGKTMTAEGIFSRDTTNADKTARVRTTLSVKACNPGCLPLPSITKPE